MADNTQAHAAADAPAKVAAAVADTAEKIVNESAKTEKRARAATARRAKRGAAATDAPARKSARAAKTTRTAKPRRAAKTNTRSTARKAAAATQTRTETLTNDNFFAGFNAIPATTPFANLFNNAGERGQETVRRSQQAVEQIADLTRANVEAVVEAGRVAVEGARALGQDAVARSREGVEQTADAIRALAEAKSPTEFVQLQSEFARTSFDRLVAESARLTESMVKLAGEAIQPISNRATANAERLNSFVA